MARIHAGLLTKLHVACLRTLGAKRGFAENLVPTLLPANTDVLSNPMDVWWGINNHIYKCHKFKYYYSRLELTLYFTMLYNVIMFFFGKSKPKFYQQKNTYCLIVRRIDWKLIGLYSIFVEAGSFFFFFLGTCLIEPLNWASILRGFKRN